MKKYKNFISYTTKKKKKYTNEMHREHLRRGNKGAGGV